MGSLAGLKPYSMMLVDAMNFLSRSFYGMHQIEYKGRKTGMLMGVARLVLDWRKKNPGMRFLFVFEGANSWRKAAHPVYKGNRGGKPSASRIEFNDSLEQVKSALPIMGIDQVWAETFEADDTVWTVLPEYPGRRLFCSTDWDWWPLVKYGDILYENHVMTEPMLKAKFAKKFNCDPIPMERMPIFKILTGDSSDNLSGVPRLPRKIAAEIANDPTVDEYSLVDGLVRHGYETWAEKAAQNIWLIDRNRELIMPTLPNSDILEWETGSYDPVRFGDVLLKNGMGDLHERLIEEDRYDRP